MTSLPFELYKNHKSSKRKDWKKLGIKIDEDDFDYVYNEYIHATNCDLCNKLFLNTIDRCLDHNHETGEIRNIVCNKCNSHRKDNLKKTNTGEDHIYKVNSFTMKNGYCFQIRLYRNGKYLLRTSRKSIEEAIICRDEFLKNNSNIFT